HREEQVLELDRNLRAVGRLGWPLRSRSTDSPQLRRDGISRADADDFALREERLRLARRLRNRERAYVRRRCLWLAASRRGRRARGVAGSRLLRFLARSTRLRADQS